MIQPAQHQTYYPQSRHPAGLSFRGVANPPPLGSRSQRSLAPHFGGILPQRFTQWMDGLLLSTFSKVVEVFLWAYITQDVVAMWLPRIRQSLIRGRIPYHAKDDPQNQGLTPWQLFKKSFLQNAKGLNWINFWEETKREIAAGPGTLGLPTLIFAFARRSFGYGAVELGHGPLTQLTQSFTAHLQNTKSGLATAKSVTAEQYKTELKDFLASRFAFSQEALDTELKGVKLQVLGKKNPQALTLGSLIHEWADRWVEESFRRPWKEGTAWEKFKHWLRGVDPQQEQALQRFNEDLDRGVVEGFNRSYRPFEQRYTLDHVPLRLMENGKEAVLHQELLQFVSHELRRWKGFALTLFDEKTLGGKPKTGFVTELPVMAKELYRKLVVMKAFFALLATILTSFYIRHLAKWSQSHSTYVANRLIPEGAKELSISAALPGVQPLMMSPDPRIRRASDVY